MNIETRKYKIIQKNPQELDGKSIQWLLVDTTTGKSLDSYYYATS